MTIQLPQDVERSIEAAVQSGRFASVDDALTEAARMLLRELGYESQQVGSQSNAPVSARDPVLGLMQDDADLMDEIVADAYRHRRHESWREVDL